MISAGDGLGGGGGGGVAAAGSDLESFPLSPFVTEFGLTASVISASLAISVTESGDNRGRIEREV